MAARAPVPDGWKQIERPPALFRRYEFASYNDTSAFLERLATLSNEVGLYPDLSFGNTYVNVTLHGEAGNLPGLEEVAFADRAATLGAGAPDGAPER